MAISDLKNVANKMNDVWLRDAVNEIGIEKLVLAALGLLDAGETAALKAQLTPAVTKFDSNKSDITSSGNMPAMRGKWTAIIARMGKGDADKALG